jgi:hypothetical protein
MANYQQGKIYKLISSETNDVYVGSTCKSLKERMINHKAMYKQSSVAQKKLNMTAFKLLKYNDCDIELIEDYPCDSRKELERREGEIIKNMDDCINKNIAGRNGKEYREDHPNEIKTLRDNWYIKNPEYNKDYYDKNKDKNKDKLYAREECKNCGKLISHVNMSKHKKSKACINHANKVEPKSELTELQERIAKLEQKL